MTVPEKPMDGYHDEKNWSDDIHSIINFFKLDKPVLVGWSYGGKVVLDYIRVYGEKNIAGINLVDVGTSSSISGGSYYTPDSQAIIPGLISTDALESSNSLQKFVNLLFYYKPSENNFYFILGYNTVVPPYVREAIITRSVSYDNLLTKIKLPVLLTYDVKDRILYPSQSIYNSKIIKNSKLSLYECTVHSPFWERPARFNAEIASFVESL